MLNNSWENGSRNGNIFTISYAKRFWRYLVVSNLLSAELIKGFPISKLGGYYSVASNIGGHEGVRIILSRGMSNNLNFSGIISQEDAYTISKKYDNCEPPSGKFVH